MEFSEYPLLNDPHLMLVVLKVAARGDAGIADCVDHLRRSLAAAREAPPVTAAMMAQCLRRAKLTLQVALLIEVAGPERFRITPRGREVLEQHPLGFDESLLMQFSEFRRFLRETEPSPAGSDPRDQQMDEGAAAYRDGRSHADNPYALDSVDHQAWEEGWFTARDEVEGQC